MDTLPHVLAQEEAMMWPCGVEHEHAANCCLCYVTPESEWFYHYSAVEPGSQMEPNPDCPVHFPIEQRPDDDPWIPTCDGRNCGGYPHE